jgi:hypothetical protein
MVGAVMMVICAQSSSAFRLTASQAGFLSARSASSHLRGGLVFHLNYQGKHHVQTHSHR